MIKLFISTILLFIFIKNLNAAALECDVDDYLIQKHIQKYELEITANCNAECPLCARTEMGMKLRGNNELTFENIKQIFPTRESCDNKEFKLCGVLGDPILNNECFEIAEYISNFGGRINLDKCINLLNQPFNF